MRTTDTHVYFVNGLYSNWYGSPFKMPLTPDGVSLDFSCSEQAFIASKAVVFGDFEAAAKIMATHDPKEQKLIGRQVKDFDQVIWMQVAPFRMYNACAAKFWQNEHLGNELLNTGDRIMVEAAWYDQVWGVGLRESDDAILDEKNWLGLNWLGKTLMIVRENLKIARENKLSFMPHNAEQFNVFKLS